jgi:hypothetical protein
MFELPSECRAANCLIEFLTADQSGQSDPETRSQYEATIHHTDGLTRNQQTFRVEYPSHLNRYHTWYAAGLWLQNLHPRPALHQALEDGAYVYE